MKRVLLYFLMLVMLITLAGCGSSSQNASVQKQVRQGANAVISVDNIASTTPETEKELSRYVNADNVSAVQRMIDRGTAFSVNKGDKVTVIERGIMSTKVEMLSGKSKGKTGYLPNEFVVAE